MKILIVDDNVAIQEILRDILADEGHNVRLAGSVDEAVHKISDFQPDAVFLDTRVADDDGLHVISIVREEMPGFELRVILLKNASEKVPTDDPFIRSGIDKPFRSVDVINALRDIQFDDMEEAKAEKEAKKEKKKAKGSIFSRKKDRIQPPVDEMVDRISFGMSYVMFEPVPSDIYRFIGLFDPHKFDILVVTVNKAKAVKERFSYEGMEIIPLSASGKEGRVGIFELGTLTSRIKTFFNEKERPVIVFDTFGEIIAANGINQSLLMMQQLISGSPRMCTFGLSVDPSILTDKDRSILLHNMTEYSTEE